jgi:hypothetical protein
MEMEQKIKADGEAGVVSWGAQSGTVDARSSA